MKKSLFRAVSLLLAALFAAAFTGCGRFVFPPASSPAPTAQAAPPPSPSPSAAVLPQSKGDVPSASEQLRALDLDMFLDAVGSDPLSLKLSLKDPSVYGIEMPEATWGEISYEDALESKAEWEAWYETLSSIDREALSPAEQLTYDTFAQELSAGICGAEYFWYEEVLSPLNGLHTNLPFNFVLYELDSREDAENYLALLEDASRFMAEEVLNFEREKAQRGTFMNDVSLDVVLEQLRDFADAGESCFLYATFRDQLEPLGLTEEEENEYLARNDAAVEALLQAYDVLHDGLEALRGTKKEGGALCEYGKEGLAYFQEGLNAAGCTVITPEEAARVLETQIETEYMKVYSAIAKNPDFVDEYGKTQLTVGSSVENLNLLEELYPLAYPALEEHSVRFIDVPEELEDQFSPAAYLVPPIDDATENTIIINTKSMADSPTLLDTIAHEGYPGHMYHYIYIRSLQETTGLYRQTMDLTGYYESWSQYAENFFDENNTAFDNDLCVMMSADGRITNVLMPAYLSIMINGEGWDEKDCIRYCSDYFGDETGEMLGEILYECVLYDPFYYIEYALGYSLLQQKIAGAKETLGSGFDIAAFNEAFLNIGPTYFNLMEPILDGWVLAQLETA
ncbi:MAG: DUF885 domain-containing protein [Clostridia bacterium]|nr:DUF885 domain-containing protein [Clostridia bacterium]